MPAQPDPPDGTARPTRHGPGRHLGRATAAGRDAGTDNDPQRADGWTGLHAAAAAGPFFVVDELRPEQRWLPLCEFADHPDGLAGRVAATLESPLLQPLHRGTPHAVVLRVAASVAFLGLAARLVSPAIGSALSAGIVPAMSWDRLHWRPTPTGVVPLACGPVEGQVIDPGSATNPAALLSDSVDPVLALGTTVADRYGLSDRIVQGNVASAIAGAAVAVARSGRCTERAAGHLTTALLRQPGMAGSGSLVGPDGTAPRLRRNSCCLLYRAGGGLCGDCILAGAGR